MVSSRRRRLAGEDRRATATGRGNTAASRVSVRDALVPLLLLAFAMMDNHALRAELLCQTFDLPKVDGVTCEARGFKNSSCSISRYSEDSCFFLNSKCWLDISTFNETTGIEEPQLSDISIWNISEPSLPILLTTSEPSFWIVETDEGAKSVDIRGLPGNLTDLNLFDSASCLGCPPPQFEWNPVPRLHLIHFKVPNETKNGNSLSNSVEILLYSSNETNFSKKCFSMHLNHTKKVIGPVDQFLTIKGLYSTEYCIDIQYRNTTKMYRCGNKFNMAERPNQPTHVTVQTQSWWILLLTCIVVIFLSAMVYSFAMCRGWLQAPCVRGRRRQAVPNDGTRVDSSSVAKERRSPSTHRESKPFLNGGIVEFNKDSVEIAITKNTRDADNDMDG